jgi:hypothetical protein
MNIKRRFGATAGATVLTAGLAVGAGIALSGAANAAPCSGTTLITDNCTISSTADVGTGALQMLPPNALSWTPTLTGTAQSVVDAADTGIAVSDLSGTGGGWNVTASATTFTNGTATFPDTGTLSIDGSTTAGEVSTPPAASCLVPQGGAPQPNCTLPTGFAPTWPLPITTATTTPSAVTVYSAATSTGIGLIALGDVTFGGNTSSGAPFAWWINVPAYAIPGTYASTVTMAIATGP